MNRAGFIFCSLQSSTTDLWCGDSKAHFENEGILFWDSYNKDPTIFGTISGSPCKACRTGSRFKGWEPSRTLSRPRGIKPDLATGGPELLFLIGFRVQGSRFRV